MRNPFFALLLILSLSPMACSSETEETITVDPNAPRVPQLVDSPMQSDQDNGDLIESVQMDWNSITYKGEAVNIEKPILFFADGMACLDTTFLVSGLDRPTYQAQNPTLFRPWRRNPVGDIELRSATGEWVLLASTKVYRPIARGETLSSQYYLKYSENLQVSTQTSLDLVYDGSFKDGTGKKGSYAIEGYLLTLNYEDGSTVTKTIIMDPSSPRDIWLDNEPYHADTVTIYSDD